MTELIELRPVKARRSQKRSYTLTTAQTLDDSSDDDDDDDDDSSSEEESSPVVFNLQRKPKKSTKRKNKIQTLPIIINQKSNKEKRRSPQKHIQQFLINTQPPASPKKKEIILQKIMPSRPSPTIQFVPISAPPPPPVTTVIEREPYPYPYHYPYRPVYTPSLIEEHPLDFYRSYPSPMRRFERRYPPHSRSVRLPRHARKIVNRFLNGMEHAHGYRYCDGSDSDHSIDNCRICRRVRSAMNDSPCRSHSEVNVYHGSRTLFETKKPHVHKHVHSEHCQVCNLLDKSDLAISTIEDHSKPIKKKHGKQVHIVESYPSRIKPVEQTTTTTTTTATQPNVLVNTNSTTAIPPVPMQPIQYPMGYGTYSDPNGGLAYPYDPYWQYNVNGVGMPYDYTSYYNNPTYYQSNLQSQTYNTTVPPVINPPNPTTQQTQTQTVITPNPLVDTGTYTYMPNDRKKRKTTKKTVVVHTGRNPTPPAPQIIIEQPRASPPRKIKSTTVLKERTTQAPHTTTTTYVRT